MNNYFLLFSCCVPVKGAKRSIVCDLQREDYLSIPNVLYEILTTFRGHRIADIKEYFNNKHDAVIDDYFTYLKDQQYGFFTDDTEQFPLLDTKHFFNYQTVTNAVVDFDDNSKHDIKTIVDQLSALGCESLEIRFFSYRTLSAIEELLNSTQDSTLRSIHVLMKYGDGYTEESILMLQRRIPRLKRILVHSAPADQLHEHTDIILYFCKEKVSSEQCCGVVSPWYFTINTPSFVEAKSYNSCLNKKIGIDTQGRIKNCPSMVKSYGNIQTKTLDDIVHHTDFRDIWSVTKDKIEVCKDCEFRYICQDCRAYVSDKDNFLSKPAKCNYNPYNDTSYA
ncbi:hypothetical protein FM107_19250 [Sphingobacterium sp. JB170]|nr:hypothetical protein FM107_19250 [Sphingobacterium sp. JB170]